MGNRFMVFSITIEEMILVHLITEQYIINESILDVTRTQIALTFRRGRSRFVVSFFVFQEQKCVKKEEMIHLLINQWNKVTSKRLVWITSFLNVFQTLRINGRPELRE